MSRPLYQTERHIETQETIADFIADRLGCKMLYIPKRTSFVDYLAKFPDGRRAVVEIKDRPSTKWGDDLQVSVEKMMMLQSFCSLFERVRAVFAVRFRDGEVGWVYVSDIGDSLHVGGRRDRGDPDDVELMVSIPGAHFKRIGKMEVER